MSKPKPMIEKSSVTIKLSEELKRDIQTLAVIFDRPFTVYIEEVMQKHINANRAMINEERKMKEELRKKYATGVTNGNIISVVEKYVVKNKERIEKVEENSTLSKEMVGGFLPKRGYMALRIPEIKKEIKAAGISYEETGKSYEKQVDLLNQTRYFCVDLKDLSAEAQAVFENFNTQTKIDLMLK